MLLASLDKLNSVRKFYGYSEEKSADILGISLKGYIEMEKKNPTLTVNSYSYILEKFEEHYEEGLMKENYIDKVPYFKKDGLKEAALGNEVKNYMKNYGQLENEVIYSLLDSLEGDNICKKFNTAKEIRESFGYTIRESTKFLGVDLDDYKDYERDDIQLSKGQVLSFYQVFSNIEENLNKKKNNPDKYSVSEKKIA